MRYLKVLGIFYKAAILTDLEYRANFVTNVLMSIVVNLQVFVPAFSITRGGPNSSTLYMVYYIFRTGFMNNRFGYASAVSLIFFAFISLVTAVVYSTSRKWMFFEGE